MSDSADFTDRSTRRDAIVAGAAGAMAPFALFGSAGARSKRLRADAVTFESGVMPSAPKPDYVSVFFVDGLRTPFTGVLLEGLPHLSEVLATAAAAIAAYV